MLRKDSVNKSRQRVHCILHYASYQTFPVVKSSYRESTYQASWKMPGMALIGVEHATQTIQRYSCE